MLKRVARTTRRAASDFTSQEESLSHSARYWDMFLMGLSYEDLDEETRRFMIEEIEMDVASDKIYRSSYLNQRAQGSWPDYLLDAARSGSDDSLALAIRRDRLLNSTSTRFQKGKLVRYQVPYNANEVLAESEFNRYFVRGLSRKAMAAGLPRLEVYRAKRVREPRPESQAKIGLLCEPEVLLIDVRASNGVETALGIPPGPGTGITVRIPRSSAT